MAERLEVVRSPSVSLPLGYRNVPQRQRFSSRVSRPENACQLSTAAGKPCRAGSPLPGRRPPS